MPFLHFDILEDYLTTDTELQSLCFKYPDVFVIVETCRNLAIVIHIAITWLELYALLILYMLRSVAILKVFKNIIPLFAFEMKNNCIGKRQRETRYKFDISEGSNSFGRIKKCQHQNLQNGWQWLGKSQPQQWSVN